VLRLGRMLFIVVSFQGRLQVVVLQRKVQVTKKYKIIKMYLPVHLAENLLGRQNNKLESQILHSLININTFTMVLQKIELFMNL